MTPAKLSPAEVERLQTAVLFVRFVEILTDTDSPDDALKVLRRWRRQVEASQ